ncbi:MAG: glycoside hydrolase superfamily [Linnemannia gamsii]|nr:MAG: glycoside hydrolase superfamily [Linnemannia gamsii]
MTQLHPSQSSTTLTEDTRTNNNLPLPLRTLNNSPSTASLNTNTTANANAWFKDHTGRTVTLRGVNLSGASKMPVGVPSHQTEGFLHADGTEVSFVGRPFPLEDADEHLGRLKHWGFNLLRFIVTWESIEHAGPGKYDMEFFEYLVQVLHKCKEYGFKCFLDPHQDVWSRFSGGSGAPLWTLHLAGLDPSHFAQTNAAIVHNTYEDPENYPKMIWVTNYTKLAAATMFTLFFAGSIYAPNCVVDNMNIQDYLQTHYIKSYMALAEYINAQHGIEDDVVIGYDTLNEPSAGWIGIENISKIPETQEYSKELTPTPLQAMLLGQGHKQTVEFWALTFFGPKRKGNKTVDPEGVTAWLSPEDRAQKDKRFGWKRAPQFPKAGECIWAQHGVWDLATQQVLVPDYFLFDPSTKEKFDFGSRSFLPFCRRFAQAVRTIHKAAIIFLEPPVNELPPSLPPPHDDDDVAQFDITSRVVYAPHWYDGLTLLNKRWNFFNIDYLGVKRGRYANYAAAVKIGEKAIRECFRHQLACIQEEGQAALGMHPTLIGEIGIPYDMSDKKSYKPNGNYKDQIKAMDANMYALESNHLNFTLWNYCADNSHKWGDLWNGEDLSLWSKDDLDKDPRKFSNTSSTEVYTSQKNVSLNSLSSPRGRQLLHPDIGGRAVIAFCRPYAQKVAGTPLDISFSLNTVTFKFSFKRTPNTNEPGAIASNPLNSPKPGKLSEPTEIYLPRIHFPGREEYLASLGGNQSAQSKPKEPVCPVVVSGGHWEWREQDQILLWWTGEGEDNDYQSEAGKKRSPSLDDGVYEITVVGKKWAGNSFGSTAKTGGSSLWNTVSQCCRIS